MPNLLRVIREAFPPEWLFTPPIKARVRPDGWPSLAEMRQHGARVVLVSRWGYGADAAQLMFSRYASPRSSHSVPAPPPPRQHVTRSRTCFLIPCRQGRRHGLCGSLGCVDVVAAGDLRGC